jgi:dihydrofolate synthase/folylpolyglutamate synthase
MANDFATVEAALASRDSQRMELDLARIEALLDLLGSPQRAYPAIHIAGTNGKTSTARMIDSLLRAHGLRTGRFTSPALTSVREQVTVDGEAVTEERFVEIYEEVAPVAEFLDTRDPSLSLTYFELLTAIALATFADAPVDVAIVEAGLGGVDDATNVLQATTVVLTPIGLDHMQWLGDTIEEIAVAKAGIIYSGANVVCAEQSDDAMDAIVRQCVEVGATIAREGKEFGVVSRALAVGGQVLSLQGLGGTYHDVFVPLHGAHQAQNAAVALAAVEAFLGSTASTRQLDPEVVREGFAGATSPGRLERVRSAPTMLLDAAHNPHGMAATARALVEEFAFSRLVAVIAVLADKDAAGMLEVLESVVDAVVCTRNSSPRAMPPDRLGEIAVEIFGEDRVRVVPDLPDAIAAAVDVAESDVDDLASVGIVILGSVVTAADARRLIA